MFSWRVSSAEKDKQPGRVVQLLRRLIPENATEADLRDWEFYHLWRKYLGEESRLRGHRGAVTAVAFSPDDSLLASASTDRTIKIWDTIAGKERVTLTGHAGAVNTVAFSPDGKRLVSGSADAVVKVWDTTKGKELLSLHGHTGPVTSSAFSPDGLHVASASEDCSVRVWETDTGRTITEFKKHMAAINGLAFSPDGLLLASTAKADIQIWKPLTGEVVKVPKVGNRGPDSGRNTALAFSPDGKQLAVGYTENEKLGPTQVEITGRVAVWNLTTETTIRKLNHQPGVTQVAFSPDGAYLASSSKADQTIRVWDSASGAEVAVLKTGDGPQGLAFSPDSLRIASGSEDRLVLVFAIPGAKPKTMRQGSVHNVIFNAEGDLIAAGVGATVVWDPRTGKELKRLGGVGQYGRIAWSSKDNLFAGIPVGKVTEGTTGQVRQKLEAGVVRQGSGGWGHAFSPDGQLIAEATGSEIAVWNVGTGQLVHHLKPRGGWVGAVAISPDGRFLAAGCGQASESPLQVWDLRTGQLVFAADTFLQQVWAVAFSPDGNLLAAAGGDYMQKTKKFGAIRIWDTKTCEVVRTMESHSTCLFTVQFSPNGRRLVASGGMINPRVNQPGKPNLPGEVTMWDVDSGQEVWTMQDFKFAVYGVAFSPDGRRLAIGADGTVQILDGTPLAALPDLIGAAADD
jgi:WD40 repeat protein